MFFLLAACSPDVDLPEGSASVSEVEDLRRDDFPLPPEGGMQWITPDYVIPAFSEQMMCWVTTWEGETTGISGLYTYQSPLGHHVVVNLTNADPTALPDGSTFDCTKTEDLPMTELEPLMVGGVIGGAENNNEGAVVLPEGMATRLASGSRLILQSHYVNATANDILVRDVVNVAFVPESEVDIWAAAFVHVQTDLAIPEGPSSIDFKCTWEQDATLLFLGGHMHEWGASFSTKYTPIGGEETVIYDIPAWDPLYRDAPPVNDYQAAPWVVFTGDSFTTHCAWDNDTGGVLEFPAEMCVTFGMFYPSQIPVVCES